MASEASPISKSWTAATIRRHVREHKVLAIAISIFSASLAWAAYESRTIRKTTPAATPNSIALIFAIT